MNRLLMVIICVLLPVFTVSALGQDNEFTVAPGDAIVNVTSQPPGAYLSINGAFIGNTPVSGIPLRSGTYLLTAEYPEYVKGEMKITLAEDEARVIDFRLSAGSDSSGWWSTRDYWIGTGIGGVVFLILLFTPAF